MRQIFIINPAAGQGEATKLTQSIKDAAEALGVEIELYFTTGIKDAERFTRTVCRNKNSDEPVRFYACGGDGTLNEVANGSFGASNVEVGHVPTGTGNDYVRDYNKPEAFLNITDQLKGKSISVDLFQYQGIIDGIQQTRYCTNMMNIGFDCNVVYRTSILKTKPFIKGSLAYYLGIFYELIKKNGTDLKLLYEDGSLIDGKILLAAVAIGGYCGGGIKGLPRAKQSDGLFDVQVIQNTTRRMFVRLLPKYIKGTHLEDGRTKSLIDYRQVKHLEITPNQGFTRVCVDGEMETAGHLKLDIVPNALNFILPDFSD